MVYAITPSADGSIWVASETGLYRYRQGCWITYDTEDGLPSGIFYTVFEDSRRRIWVGTSDGIRQLHPEADADPPDTYMDAALNTKSVAPGEEAKFIPSGVDKWKRIRKERLLYSHRLDEREWTSFVNQTVATYADIPSGSHRFEVRAMDINGNVDPTPAVWEFWVKRPWYQEPGFLVMSTCGSLLTVFLGCLALSRHRKVQRSNRHLQEANAKLLELDQMKSAFVSQASHDLRTPLTAIKGSLDNLLLGIAGEVNQKQKKVIERATHSVDRLTGLVNDVLDLSRIESGRTVLEKSSVSLVALVETVLQECKPAADQKLIELHWNRDGEIPPLPLDEGKIQRVIGELVSNAIKYTSEGGRVHIGLGQTDGVVTLAVQDSGIGMSPEECRKIWERFYRTPQSQKMAKGSGLGLSIAKELVEMYGGRLAVESEVGKGTAFTLLLPRNH